LQRVAVYTAHDYAATTSAMIGECCRKFQQLFKSP
jgi:hypothetical protein